MALSNGYNPTFPGKVTALGFETLGSGNVIATGTTGSHQTVSGDITYAGNAGGTSTYHAGVMGNFMGDNLTNTNASYHAGVIGSYNVTTDDDNIGVNAGVIGEVGDLADNSAYGVVAVLGGDSGAMAPHAAFGVAYFNSTAGSKFDYGMDLYHAAINGFNAVTYGKADVRLSNQKNIYSGTAVTRAAVRALVGDSAPQGSLFIGTGSVATTKPNMYVKVLAANADTDWERIVTAATD